MAAAINMEDFEDFEDEVDRVNKLIKGMISGEIMPQDVDKEFCEEKPKKKCNVFNDRKSVTNSWGGNEMSQEAFMRAVEEDANRRAKERKERNLKSDELKNKGNAAFRKGDFPQALSWFNQALDIRRDSSVLYVNRALAYLKLEQYDKVCQDCDSALKLKNAIKPRLLKLKAMYSLGYVDKSREYLNETLLQFPDKRDDINGFNI